ncbi:hypothetical protein ACNTMW_25875 [Planosporangium sp. 12N6]|uniref:hypothetical protein n=1 Tax=Planosporangium spinosum TaxID=3402278 RepID=UPI003CE8B134
MIWSLVIVLVVGSLVLLAVAVAPLVRRMGELGVAARRLGLRRTDVQRLMPALAALQQRAEQLQHDVATVEDRAARTRARRR